MVGSGPKCSLIIQIVSVPASIGFDLHSSISFLGIMVIVDVDVIGAIAATFFARNLAVIDIVIVFGCDSAFVVVGSIHGCSLVELRWALGIWYRPQWIGDGLVGDWVEDILRLVVSFLYFCI